MRPLFLHSPTTPGRSSLKRTLNRTFQIHAATRKPSSAFTRAFHTPTPTPIAANPNMPPVFAQGYDPAQGTADLETLLRSQDRDRDQGGAGGGGRWTLIPSGKGVERAFRFKGFGRTWDFMNVVAQECKVRKHHPEWSNVYNTVFIRWTTHSPPGLSAKDVLMARFCDEQAEAFGEVEPVMSEGEAEGEERGGLGKELADRVAAEGADCCVPIRKGRGKVDVGGC